MPTKGNHDVKEVNYFQWVNFTIKAANKSIINAFFLKIRKHELLKGYVCFLGLHVF